MEDVDLGGNRELIAMVYGQDKYAPITPPPSASPSSGSKQEEKEVQKKKKPPPRPRTPPRDKKSGILCSLSLCCSLTLLAILAIAAAAAITHVVTKKHLKKVAIKPKGEALVAMKYNMSYKDAEASDDDAEEAARSAAEKAALAAELAVVDADRHIPDDLQPVWYNLSLKVYVPGYAAEIPAEKKGVFDGTMLLLLRVHRSTDQIQLHADRLSFDLEHPEHFELFKSVRALRYKRSENSTEAAEESLADGFTEQDEEYHVGDPHHEEVHATLSSTEVPETLVPLGVSVRSVSVDVALRKVFFNLDKNLTAGEDIIFRMSYTGPIRDSLNGLFQSQYKNSEGKVRYIASTHMESEFARRFAPCFDEPRYRAAWKIEVTHPKGSNAISNGIEIGHSDIDSAWSVTSFKETLPLSTYLLSLCISDFQFIEGRSESHVRVRVYSRPEALNSTQLALSAAIKVLNFYEKHYAQIYPLEKQDLVALPTFEAGAMENWGLLMFREERLIFDPLNNDLYDKYSIYRTVSHEMSHQWFGDLVSMSWWNDLWLNEGTANYFQYLGAEHLAHEDMRVKEFLIPEMLEDALDRDADASSHPISFDVQKPRDIASVFDIITYKKGASVVRMLQGILGEETFMKGIQEHISAYMFKSTTSDDLFKSFDAAVPDDLKAWDGEKFNVATFAKNWILQMGYPVVELRRISGTEVELTQTRFRKESTAEEKPAFRNARFWFKWDIPVWHTVGGKEREMEWLHEALRLRVNASELLLINPDSRGFYRVNYDEEGWKALIEQLEKDHLAIPVTSRARLISDAFALAANGRLPYETAFALTEYMSREEQLLPWDAAIKAYDQLLQFFRDRPESRPIREFLKGRIEPLFSHLRWDNLDGFENAEFFQSRLNGEAIDFYCRLHAANCTNKLVSLFEQQLIALCPDEGGNTLASKCSRVPLAARGAAYCEGVARGGASRLRRVRELYERETHTGERTRLLEALSCTRDTGALKELLASSLLPSPEGNGAPLIPAQQLQFFLNKMAKTNPVGDYVVLDFITDHWKPVVKGLFDYQHALNKLIGGLPLHSEKSLEKLKSFLAANAASTGRFGAFAKPVEAGENERAWLAHRGADVVRLLSRDATRNATDAAAADAADEAGTDAESRVITDDVHHFSPLFA